MKSKIIIEIEHEGNYCGTCILWDEDIDPEACRAFIDCVLLWDGGTSPLRCVACLEAEKKAMKNP